MTLIPPIPKGVFKIALEKTRKSASQQSARTVNATIKIRELYRVEALGQSIADKLISIHDETADFRNLPPFMKDMVPLMVDLGRIKQALHSIKWASEKILQLSEEARRHMRRQEDVGVLTKDRKAFEARTDSIMRKIEEDLAVLDTARRRLEEMPKVREEPTVLIAGYPNVGKSSVLKALSGHKVNIQPYPFTTKQLLVGYAKNGYQSLQIVDSPGLLDREELSDIERQALLALKHLSEHVLFIIDPSESCGYSLKDQEKLLEKVRAQIPHVIVIANKADLMKDRSALPGAMWVSTKTEEGVKELKAALFERVYAGKVLNTRPAPKQED
jgi:nucleolar GTP-binding protein